MNILFPELDFEFKKYWINYGEITTTPPKLSEIDTYTKATNSVFGLLFDKFYMFNDYVSIFRETNKPNFRYPVIVDRLCCTHEDIKIFVSDSFGIQTLNLEHIDDVWLNNLLSFRNGIFIDISSIAVADLTTKLSKLIYMYINGQQNLNFEWFKDFNPIVSDSDLVYLKLFELFVINESFRKIRTLTSVLDIGRKNYILCRQKFKIIQNDIVNGYLVLKYTPELDLATMFVRNGDILESSQYQIIKSDIDESYGLVWDTTSVTIKVDDIIILDFYYEK